MKRYKQKELAEMLGVTSKTLHNWDKRGIFVARRGINGRPFYLQEDVDYVLNVGVNDDQEEKDQN